MATHFFKSISKTIKHWYIPLLIGVLLLILGFYVMSTPVASYLALSIIFSWSFLISGILQIIFAIQNKNETDNWGWYLAGGIIYSIMGILLLGNPLISITTLPFIVGFYVLFASISALSFSFDLKNYGSKNSGWLTFLGILGIIFSFFLLWNPTFAGLSLVIWTAISLMTAGVSGIIISIQLKKIKNYPNKIPQELKDKIAHLRQEYYENIHKD